jgi:membrane dipeptidase
MHTDLARLKAGGLGAQFWSVFIPIRKQGGKAGDVRFVIEQMDLTRQMVRKYSDVFEMAYTAEDIVRIHHSGKVASLLGMEGGHSIENSLPALRSLYQLGARYMTITHSKNTDWADSATDDPQHGGLTGFGIEVIKEMNRLGMLIDLSHVSAGTMHDALDASKAPVIFSHSSAFALCKHPRNVPDDVLRRLPKNSGIVMVTFLGYYISEELRLHGEEGKRFSKELEKEHASDSQEHKAAMAQWQKSNPAPHATLSQVLDHIDHVVKVAGINHVGIGSDYDGTSSIPVGLEDVSKYPSLVEGLLKRGYSDGDVRKILGENLLRVMRAAEQTAQNQKNLPVPLTRLEPPKN